MFRIACKLLVPCCLPCSINLNHFCFRPRFLLYSFSLFLFSWVTPLLNTFFVPLNTFSVTFCIHKTESNTIAAMSDRRKVHLYFHIQKTPPSPWQMNIYRLLSWQFETNVFNFQHHRNAYSNLLTFASTLLIKAINAAHNYSAASLPTSPCLHGQAACAAHKTNSKQDLLFTCWGQIMNAYVNIFKFEM